MTTLHPVTEIRPVLQITIISHLLSLTVDCQGPPTAPSEENGIVYTQFSRRNLTGEELFFLFLRN